MGGGVTLEYIRTREFIVWNVQTSLKFVYELLLMQIHHEKILGAEHQVTLHWRMTVVMIENIVVCDVAEYHFYIYYVSTTTTDMYIPFVLF